MHKFYIAVCTLLAGAMLIACSDQRVKRDDEVAMMIYRDCMSGPPPALNSADMSMSISNSGSPNPNTSIAATTQTRQEESQQIRCAQLAGWKTKP